MTMPTRPRWRAAAASSAPSRPASPEPSTTSRAAGGNEPVDNAGQDVHALLPGQPADHAEERAVVVVEAEALLHARAWLARAPCSVSRPIVRHQRLVGRRVPDVGVDAVDDAVAASLARVLSRPSRPMPNSGVRISCA